MLDKAQVAHGWDRMRRRWSGQTVSRPKLTRTAYARHLVYADGTREISTFLLLVLGHPDVFETGHLCQ